MSILNPPIWIRLAVCLLAGGPAPAQPLWVSEHPSEPGFAAGVGSALVAEGPHARQQAMNAALADIARQLRVQVQQSDRRQRQESDAGISDVFNSTLSTTSIERLHDVDVVDSWNDGHRIWVYARLDLARHQAHRDSNRQRVRRRLADPSLADLVGLAARPHGMRDTVLQVLRKRLVATNLMGRLSADSTRVQMCVGGDGPTTGLPVRFGHEVNAVRREHRLWTDSAGCITRAVRRQAGPQRFDARLDLETLSPQAHAYLAQLPQPHWSTTAYLAPRPAHLQLNVISAEPLPALRRNVVALLHSAGIDARSNPVASGVSAQVEVHVRRGARQSPCFAFVDMTIRFTQSRGQTEVVLFTDTPRRLKGAGIGFEEAIENALRQYDAYLGDAAVPQHAVQHPTDGPSDAAQTNGRDSS